MFNQALVCCLPVINALSPFLDSEKGMHASLDFRESIVSDFLLFERNAYASGIDSKKIEWIKYALAALVDECVMSSAWPGKLSWMRRSLQLQFFGEHLAGEGFFEKLSNLRQSGIVELDVLEIYALCLQLGFQGVYKFKDKTQYRALVAGLESQIELTRGKQALSLGPSVPSHSDAIKKLPRDISLGWIVMATVGLMILMGVGYAIAMRVQLHHAIQTLNAELSYDS